MGKKLKGLVRGTRNLAYRNLRSCFEKSQKTTISSRQPFIVNFTFEIYNFFPNFFITSIIKIIFCELLPGQLKRRRKKTKIQKYKKYKKTKGQKKDKKTKGQIDKKTRNMNLITHKTFDCKI